MAVTVGPERKTQTIEAKDELPFTRGSVWGVSFMRSRPGKGMEYLRELSGNWKKALDEQQREGLILSYKLLTTVPVSRDDYDTVIMIEFPNYAALDQMDKFRAIAGRVMGPLSAREQTLQKRAEIRDELGSRLLQEIHLK
jgi:hypothetical protein